VIFEKASQVDYGKGNYTVGAPLKGCNYCYTTQVEGFHPQYRFEMTRKTSFKYTTATKPDPVGCTTWGTYKETNIFYPGKDGSGSTSWTDSWAEGKCGPIGRIKTNGSRNAVKFLSIKDTVYLFGFPTKTYSWLPLKTRAGTQFSTTSKEKSNSDYTFQTFSTTSTKTTSPTAYLFFHPRLVFPETFVGMEEPPPYGVSLTTDSKSQSVMAKSEREFGPPLGRDYYRCSPVIWTVQKGFSGAKSETSFSVSTTKATSAKDTCGTYTTECDNKNYLMPFDTYSSTTAIKANCKDEKTMKASTTLFSAPDQRTFYVKAEREKYDYGLYSSMAKVGVKGANGDGITWMVHTVLNPPWLDVRFFRVNAAGVLQPYVHTGAESFTIKSTSVTRTNPSAKPGTATTTVIVTDTSRWFSSGMSTYSFVSQGNDGKPVTVTKSKTSTFDWLPGVAPSVVGTTSKSPFIYAEIGITGNAPDVVTVSAVAPVWTVNSQPWAVGMNPGNWAANDIRGFGTAILGPLWPASSGKFNKVSVTISNDYPKKSTTGNTTTEAVCAKYAEWDTSKHSYFFSKSSTSTFKSTKTTLSAADKFSAFIDISAHSAPSVTHINDRYPSVTRGQVFHDSPQSVALLTTNRATRSTSWTAGAEFDWSAYHLI
jgi:hypothetical protein